MHTKPAIESGLLTDNPRASSRLAQVVLSLSTLAAIAKVLGFAEKFIIARFFGTGDVADVYFAVTSVVLSIIWLVKELVNPALLPVFAASLGMGRHESGALFRRVFFATAGLLALTTLLMILWAPLLARVFVPGFGGLKLQVTCRLLRLLAPAVLFLGLSAVTGTVLNAHRKFIQAAWPEAALKLAVVVGLVALLPLLGIYALGIALSLGGLGCLLAQLRLIPERRFLLRNPGNGSGDAAFRRAGSLMGPLVIGAVFSHLNGLVDNVLASTLPAGQLSFLGYSRKLIDALLLIGPVALVTVIYSQLAHLASAGDGANFTILLRKGLRLMLYVGVPATCALVTLRQPLIRLLFERGRFGPASSAGTSDAFLVYAIGLTVFALEALMVHSFFAVSDTRTPVKIGVLCCLVDIVLALVLIRPLQYLGIAWAFVIARTLKVALLGILLRRRWVGVFGADMTRFAVKLALSTSGLWAATKLLLSVESPHQLFHGAVFDLILPLIGATVAFVTCSYLLRMDEFRAVLALVKDRKAAIKTLYWEGR